MSLRDIRWAPVTVILVLTVGILLGANSFYQRFYVDSPMETVMQNHPEVLEWKVTKEQKQSILTIKLGPVENLLETSTNIQKEVEPFLGKTGWELHIEDQRSPELEQVFYSIQYMVYEALTQGNFTVLADSLRKDASQAGLDRYAIYVNSHNLFIQMQKDGATLYEILPRGAEANPPVLVLGGSEQ